MTNDTQHKYRYFARTEVFEFLPSYYTKVLEIGCGVGAFRSNLELDHEYWAIEPVVKAAEEARKKLDVVLFGTFNEVENNIPDNYFDLIVCNDVIEHMPDHDDFLQRIKKKLASNGSRCFNTEC